VRVALDWTLDVFFSKDLVQLATERSGVPATRPVGGSRTAAPGAPVGTGSWK